MSALLARAARDLRNNLLAGLLVMVPVGVTIYAFRVIFDSVDSILGPHLNDLLLRLFPGLGGTRIPGLGIAATVLLLYGTGRLVRSFLGAELVRWWDAFISRVPVFGTIHKAAKQVMTAASGTQGFRRVVFVRLEDPQSFVIGFVTGQLQVAPGDLRMNVFVPTAPNPTTGVLALCKAEQLIPSDLTVEEAMKLIVSAGLVSGE